MASRYSIFWPLFLWLRLALQRWRDSLPPQQALWRILNRRWCKALLPQSNAVELTLLRVLPASSTNVRSPYWGRRQRGVTLLEIVVTVALSALLLTALSSSLATTTRAHHISDQVLLARRVESLLEAELTKFTRDYDSHPLLLPPIVHAPGSIQFVDGAFNPVMQGDSAHTRPHPRSEAISFLVLAWRDALTPTSAQSGRTQFCSRYSESLSLSQGQTLLALGIDGMWQVAIHTLDPAGSVGCYYLGLSSTDGIFLAGLPREARHTVRLIIPIVEEYTLYLSSDGELRYLGHRGKENIENQPIVSGLDSFHPVLLPPPLSGVTALALESTVKAHVVRSYAINHFSKTPYVDLVINAQ